MKIAFDAKRAAQNRTGLGNYSRFVLEGLSHFFAKNEYILYIPNRKKTKLLGLLNRASNCRIEFPTGFFWKRVPSLWRVCGMTQPLRKDKPEIYHGLSNELPLKIQAIKGLKTIVTIHDLIFLRYPEFYPLIDRTIYHKKFLSACQRADSIIAVSECTKRDIMRFFGIPEKKIKVIYQGCDKSFRETASDRLKEETRRIYHLPDEYVLYVGSIESRKNLIRIVEALSKTKNQLPLVAVGKYTPYVDEVVQKADELGVSGRLILLHRVEFIHLPALYQMSSLFVYPSYFEGFGIPILEALCSKVPVIGATGSCLEEAGGPDSIYINPDDADELAFSMDRILNGDEALKRHMIEKGIQYAARFKPDILANELMTHYQSLLKNSK